MKLLQRMIGPIVALALALVVFAQPARAQGGERVRVSVDCTTIGSTGQARVDEPHEVTLQVNGPSGPKTVKVDVPQNMTGTAIAELLIEALEDAGLPGATQTTYAAPTETEVNIAAKRVLTLPAGCKYVSDVVKKKKSGGEDDGHLSLEPEKKKSGSGFAPLAIEWIRVRAIETPSRNYRVRFTLESDLGATLYSFDQTFTDQLGVAIGFDALRQDLIANGYPAFHTQTHELFVYTGAAAVSVNAVRFGFSMADDLPDADPADYAGELREIWKDLEVL